MSQSPTPPERRRWGSGSVFRRKHSPYWWIRWYDATGRHRAKNTRTTQRRAAEAMLRDELDKKDKGVNPDARKVTFEDLVKLLLDDRRVKGRRGTPKLKHLRAAFGKLRALQITSDVVLKYEGDRLDAGAARATVNNELASLRRMFNLAVEHKKLARDQVPKISTPDPHNARQGYFERDDFDAVLVELPEYLRPVMEFAYQTGWRVPSEVLPLQWRQVDFAAGTIRLEPGSTKNREGRTFPFDVLPALVTVLEEQRARTTELEKATGQVIPWVFHRNGKPIWSYRTAWQKACDRAAHGGESPKKGKVRRVTRPALAERMVLDALGRPRTERPHVHDFRRTAVRNLERAGVPRSVAMKLTGHKTESMYRRYAMVSEADLRAGVAKVAALDARTDRKVLPFPTRRAADR